MPLPPAYPSNPPTYIPPNASLQHHLATTPQATHLYPISLMKVGILVSKIEAQMDDWNNELKYWQSEYSVTSIISYPDNNGYPGAVPYHTKV